VSAQSVGLVATVLRWWQHPRDDPKENFPSCESVDGRLNLESDSMDVAFPQWHPGFDLPWQIAFE
jgi:hypothetical protein